MSTRRFVVTLKESLGEKDALDILSVPKPRLKDAVGAMALKEPLAPEDVVAYPEIQAYSSSLSEKDAERLRADDRVAEVVEDMEVFALPDATEDEGILYRRAYTTGYKRALADSGATWPIRPGFPLPPEPPRQPFPEPEPPDPPISDPFPPWPPVFPPERPCPPGTRRVVRCVPFFDGPKPPQPIPWNIDMVGAPGVWRRVTGRGVKVAVLDTGIDDDHPDLSVSGGASFVEEVEEWDDDNGHGTHCAGIIGARNNPLGVVGVAPECSLYAVKVLSGSGSGYLSWILAGMAWCLRNDIQVLSMSLGSPAGSADEPCVVAYQRAAEQLAEAGCIVIAASGNTGGDGNYWVGHPARCPGYMAVAAVDRDRVRAAFSSHGPDGANPLSGVEISAPGVRVNSTVPGGGYGTKSGTSMACPHVSGAAALLCELRPAWGPGRIRTRLKETAADLGVPGNDSKYGAGLLDCAKAVLG